VCVSFTARLLCLWRDCSGASHRELEINLVLPTQFSLRFPRDGACLPFANRASLGASFRGLWTSCTPSTATVAGGTTRRARTFLPVRFDFLARYETPQRPHLTVLGSLTRSAFALSSACLHQPASDRPPRPCATGRRANAGASLAPSPRTGDS
jgi:hypothetical protein